MIKPATDSFEDVRVALREFARATNDVDEFSRVVIRMVGRGPEVPAEHLDKFVKYYAGISTAMALWNMLMDGQVRTRWNEEMEAPDFQLISKKDPPV